MHNRSRETDQERDSLVDGGRVAVVDFNVLDHAVEERGVVAALGAEVEEEVVLRVFGHEEADHVVDRVQERRVRPRRRKRHRDARRRHVRQRQVEAVFLVAALVGDQHPPHAFHNLDQPHEADHARDCDVHVDAVAFGRGQCDDVDENRRQHYHHVRCLLSPRTQTHQSPHALTHKDSVPKPAQPAAFGLTRHLKTSQGQGNNASQCQRSEGVRERGWGSTSSKRVPLKSDQRYPKTRSDAS
eukprot:3414332-Rhodomonas_salina.1